MYLFSSIKAIEHTVLANPPPCIDLDVHLWAGGARDGVGQLGVQRFARRQRHVSATHPRRPRVRWWAAVAHPSSKTSVSRWEVCHHVQRRRVSKPWVAASAPARKGLLEGGVTSGEGGGRPGAPGRARWEVVLRRKARARGRHPEPSSCAWGATERAKPSVRVRTPRAKAHPVVTYPSAPASCRILAEDWEVVILAIRRLSGLRLSARTSTASSAATAATAAIPGRDGEVVRLGRDHRASASRGRSVWVGRDEGRRWTGGHQRQLISEKEIGGRCVRCRRCALL